MDEKETRDLLKALKNKNLSESDIQSIIDSINDEKEYPSVLYNKDGDTIEVILNEKEYEMKRLNSNVCLLVNKGGIVGFIIDKASDIIETREVKRLEFIVEELEGEAKEKEEYTKFLLSKVSDLEEDIGYVERENEELKEFCRQPGREYNVKLKQKNKELEERVEHLEQYAPKAKHYSPDDFED